MDLFFIVSAVVALVSILGTFVCLVLWTKENLKVSPRVSSAEPIEPGHDHFPFYFFILIATNNFSDEYKLGHGVFGPVYKVERPNGEEPIAVKRLSRQYCRGLEEFTNEVLLIAQSHHKNLVRLLDFCIYGEEGLLVYKYMPNISLDCFLFGIARGLHYLHEDSRPRIIHGDLKASNILLDENMSPIISDFGLVTIFGGNQNEADGYMSPEYALEGLFSNKSDVYSFGVLLIEIVSGRRNTSLRHSNDSSSLIEYVWHLWNEGRAMELVDPCVRDSIAKNKAFRCIHIGMLCVQHSAAHRPNMLGVYWSWLRMEDEAITLPMPTCSVQISQV